MDADHVLSSGARARSVPAVLDGEIIPPGQGAASAQPSRAATAADAMGPGTILVGAVVAALLGLGAAGSYFIWSRAEAPDTASTLGQLQQDIGSLRTGVDSLKTSAESSRQDDAIRALKKSVDTLRAELDQTRTANTAALAQISREVDRPDRDAAPKLAEIAARLDKLDHDPGPKLGEIASRLDRIEKQVSSPSTTGSIATPPRVLPPGPVQPVSVQASERSKPVPLSSYTLRDVYDGIALVEGRDGGIREVTPGQKLPGAGEVRSIERRGRNWIVVTSRGVIDDSTW